MSKSQEATDTLEYFFGQFDSTDEGTKLVLDILFKVIFNVKDDDETLPISQQKEQEGNTSPGDF